MASKQSTAFTELSWPVKGLILLALALGAIVMLLPFLWMTSTACKPPTELNQLPPRFIPQTPYCAENLNALYARSPEFNRYFLNSVLLTLGRTIGQLITCSLAAYGFARFKFPGRNVIFALCLGLLMIPFQAIMIPEFILLRNFNMLNSFSGLIIPGIFSAFAMFLLRQAFMQIPIELEEAAMLDGANPLLVLWKIILPLSGPALAAFAVITIQAAWNDFMFPLVVSNTPDTRVLTLGIAFLQGQRSNPFNLIMMGSLIATVPMLLLFIALQRYFVQGVATSGLGGR